MNTITVNGVELEIDMFDADTAERVEMALEEVQRRQAEIEQKAARKELRLAEQIREICGAVFDFFNTACGEGTDKRVFGDKVNLTSALTALAEASAQLTVGSQQRIQDMVTKYTPTRKQKR